MFFFNDTATTEIYTLSLHDALPIFGEGCHQCKATPVLVERGGCSRALVCSCRVHWQAEGRSEEHTSELQSRQYLVCRVLLEKKTSTSTSSRGSIWFPTDRNNIRLHS